MADRKGWIATNPDGGEHITFDIDLSTAPCYAVYVAALKSYEGMGRFTIKVSDEKTKSNVSLDVDGLWNKSISIPSDMQVTADDKPGCTGKCQVKIVTYPQEKGRNGNKVKIMTLSARKCFDSTQEE